MAFTDLPYVGLYLCKTGCLHGGGARVDLVEDGMFARLALDPVALMHHSSFICSCLTILAELVVLLLKHVEDTTNLGCPPEVFLLSLPNTSRDLVVFLSHGRTPATLVAILSRLGGAKSVPLDFEASLGLLSPGMFSV